MENDFYYALIIGLTILLIFWLIIIIFIFFRKPPNSKLTRKLTILSLLFFVLGYLFISLFN